MIQVVHPGSGSRGEKGTGSRIRIRITVTKTILTDFLDPPGLALDLVLEDGDLELERVLLPLQLLHPLLDQ